MSECRNPDAEAVKNVTKGVTVNANAIKHSEKNWMK